MDFSFIFFLSFLNPGHSTENSLPESFLVGAECALYVTITAIFPLD